MLDCILLFVIIYSYIFINLIGWSLIICENLLDGVIGCLKVDGLEL